MEIVINNCHGGFSLSQKAIQRYAELARFKVFFYKTDYSSKEKDKKIRASENDRHACIYCLKEDIGDSPSNKKLNDAEWFSDRDIQRNDPILIQVVKELKKKANGSCAELKIVEIPDSVEWEIQEYDGAEWVAEKHRVWS